MRQVLITEEFGIYRIRTSEGVGVTGRELGPTLRAAIEATGRKLHLAYSEGDLERITGKTADIFELLVRPKPRTDGPVST